VPRFKTTGITLRDLRLAATPDGEATRAGEPMTTTELARRCHISQGHYSSVENGRDAASPFLLARLRTCFDVTLPTIYAAYAETRRTVVPPKTRRKRKDL